MILANIFCSKKIVIDISCSIMSLWWRHMSVMVFQITDNLTVCQLVRATNKKKCKAQGNLSVAMDLGGFVVICMFLWYWCVDEPGGKDLAHVRLSELIMNIDPLVAIYHDCKNIFPLKKCILMCFLQKSNLNFSKSPNSRQNFSFDMHCKLIKKIIFMNICAYKHSLAPGRCDCKVNRSHIQDRYLEHFLWNYACHMTSLISHWFS